MIRRPQPNAKGPERSGPFVVRGGVRHATRRGAGAIAVGATEAPPCEAYRQQLVRGTPVALAISLAEGSRLCRATYAARKLITLLRASACASRVRRRGPRGGVGSCSGPSDAHFASGPCPRTSFLRS